MLPIKFNPKVSTKLKDRELAEKAKKEKKEKKLSSNNIIDVIELIRQDVEKPLGLYKDEYQLITTEEAFKDYIDKANKYGYIAIDTETTGLNPLVNDIVGLCLYFPGEKAAYVPINHVDYFSGARLENQLTAEQVGNILKNLTAKVIMHNAQFDIRVIKHSLGVKLICYWDTLVGGTILNENELHGLKYLHSKYISHEDEKTFKDFFGNIIFTDIPIEYAYLYATHDAVDTFDLFEYQSKFLTDDTDRQDYKDMYWLFKNIEIPMIEVIVALEDNGVSVNMEYVNELKEKYHANLKNSLDKCYEEMNKYKDKIDTYKANNIDNKLEDPINIGSSTQLAILFYDILHAPKLKNKKDRCTDVDCMNFWKTKYPIAQYILDFRAAQKITSTYVDNIADILHTDGRIHTHFKSNGAKTGRMSSNDPINLQNIPSHNEDIRKMFVGETSYRDVEQRSDGAFIFNRCEEVETTDGWKFVEQLKAGDEIIDDDGNKVVKLIKVKELKVLVGVM